jgi:RNA polymerase sigma factor (TIGR02999 family)
VNEDAKWDGREHFFAAAAEAMRRILVDHARGRMALKRGGGLQRVDLHGLDWALPAPEEELLQVNDALDRLADVDTCAAEIVKLCFFVGLTQEEAARELRVSLATAERRWAFARAWLLRELKRMRDGSA